MGSNGQTTKENIIWGKTMNAGKEQPVYYSLVVLFNENRFYITSIKPGMRIRAREKGPVTGKDLPDTNIGIAVSEKPGIAFGHGNKKLGKLPYCKCQGLFSRRGKISLPPTLMPL